MTKYHMLKSKHSHKFLGEKPRIYTDEVGDFVFSNGHYNSDDFSKVAVHFDESPDPVHLGCVVQNTTTGAFLCGNPRVGRVEESLTEPPRRYETVHGAGLGVSRRDDPATTYKILYIKPNDTRVRLPGTEE